MVDALPARLAWNQMLSQSRAGREAGLEIRRGHVCLLAWYFPPFVTGGTYRPVSLVTYGTEAGLTFSVITGPTYGEPSDAGRYLARQLPSSVETIRVRPPPLSPWRGAVPALDGGALNVLQIWRAALQAFSDDRPEFVVATGPPFHTFVAGHLLARKFDVPLVLEYRDEWTECPFDFVHAGPIDRAWEGRCLAAAWRVIFTTRSQMEHCLDVFSELERERCAVIPNGWEPNDVPPPGEMEPAATDGERCTISFTGNLGDHALPGELLTSLAAAVARRPDLAGRFTFRFVGRRSRRAAAQLRRFPIPEMIEVTDQVPKRDVNRILRSSDGLLLLNPPALERYIPGKLYEYLASGRPILVYGEDGESAELVERLSAGIVVAEGDVSRLIEALDRVAARPDGTQLPAARAGWIQDHTREALARRTVALLDGARLDESSPEVERTP